MKLNLLRLALVAAVAMGAISCEQNGVEDVVVDQTTSTTDSKSSTLFIAHPADANTKVSFEQSATSSAVKLYWEIGDVITMISRSGNYTCTNYVCSEVTSGGAEFEWYANGRVSSKTNNVKEDGVTKYLLKDDEEYYALYPQYTAFGYSSTYDEVKYYYPENIGAQAYDYATGGGNSAECTLKSAIFKGADIDKCVFTPTVADIAITFKSKDGKIPAKVDLMKGKSDYWYDHQYDVTLDNVTKADDDIYTVHVFVEAKDYKTYGGPLRIMVYDESEEPYMAFKNISHKKFENGYVYTLDLSDLVEGSEIHPYVIGSAEELGAAVGTSEDKYYILANDIVAESPIGTQSAPFSGNLDGDGHTVSLAMNDDADYQGLFGAIDGGSVSNIIVEGTITTSGSNVGGVAGYANNAALLNCQSSVAISAQGDNVGGLVGTLDGSSTIINSCFVRWVTGNEETSASEASITGANQVGGIAGKATANTNINCVYAGTDITGATEGANIGGIIGESLGTVGVCWYEQSEGIEFGCGNSTADAETMQGGIHAHLTASDFDDVIQLEAHKYNKSVDASDPSIPNVCAWITRGSSYPVMAFYDLTTGIGFSIGATLPGFGN